MSFDIEDADRVRLLDAIKRLGNENKEMKSIGNKLKSARGCESASLEWVVNDTLEELERWIDNTAKLNKEIATLKLQLSEFTEASSSKSDWCLVCKQGWDCAKTDQQSRVHINELEVENEELRDEKDFVVGQLKFAHEAYDMAKENEVHHIAEAHATGRREGMEEGYHASAKVEFYIHKIGGRSGRLPVIDYLPEELIGQDVEAIIRKATQEGEQ